MAPGALAVTAELILRQYRPVLIHLSRIPGADQYWPSDRVPTGRTRWATVGRYDASITLAELRDDSLADEVELTCGGRGQKLPATTGDRHGRIG